MAFSVGIDLGTTNTVASIAKRGINDTVEVTTEVIDQMAEDGMGIVQEKLLPSVLYVGDGEQFVGVMAKAMKGQSNDRVIFNSKNRIGDSECKWVIDRKEYTPEVVAACFLKSIRSQLMNKYDDEESMDSVVITVPASFNLDQRNATKRAAQIANFTKDVILISEPTAAILDLVNQQSKYVPEDRDCDFSDYKNILVFDLGGGTCDVAILSIKMEERKIYIEEKAVSEHTLIGGTNFDVYGMDGIIKDFEKENNIKLKEILSKEEYIGLQSKILVQVEKLKMFFGARKQLPNAKDEKDIKMDIVIPSAINGKPFKYTLTMEKYNEFIKGLLKEDSKENIIKPIHQALDKEAMIKEDIDYIFTVGGMTRYPKVNETITEFFNREPLKLADAMESVSRGAAIYHYYDIEFEVSDHKDIVLTPKLPQTIFLNVKDGLPIPLIEVNTKAGTPKIINNVIKVNTEDRLTLELFAGLSIWDPKLTALEKAVLEFPVGVERGSGVSLKIEYTEKGTVEFEAWVEGREDIKINLELEGAKLNEKEIDEITKEFGIDKVGGVI